MKKDISSKKKKDEDYEITPEEAEKLSKI
jgi:hypothetical protein